MVFRKLPGVSAPGLRLSQKFVFLLFLSGLVTLCFGALFFLPDSVRLKRIFLSRTETQPVTVGSENDLKRAKDPDTPRGMASSSAKGETTSTKVRPFTRKAPSVTRGAGTEDRPVAAGGDGGAVATEEQTASRSRTESASERSTASNQDPNKSDTFSYDTFRRCLLKAPLGKDMGRPSDPHTAERRDKVREIALCKKWQQEVMLAGVAQGQEPDGRRWAPSPVNWFSTSTFRPGPEHERTAQSETTPE
ncbi:unnamed protein product [Gadus morhua 'NCC']